MLVVGVANTNNSIILNTEPEFWKPHSLYNKHDCTFGIHTFSDVYMYVYTLHTFNTCTLWKLCENPRPKWQKPKDRVEIVLVFFRKSTTRVGDSLLTT